MHTCVPYTVTCIPSTEQVTCQNIGSTETNFCDTCTHVMYMLWLQIEYLHTHTVCA